MWFGPNPRSKILATLTAQHARVVEKGSNFLAPPERNFASLERRSSCGTDQGFWERSPQPLEERGLAAESPELEIFVFFGKINLISGLFW